VTMTDTTSVRSADGTRIAYFRAGAGTPIILIDPALSTHRGSTKLSAAIAPRFSAISYDRRGRGASGDEQPSTADPAREVEDIAALVDAAGGRAILFGSSSGAALALEAAASLGDRVSGVVLYEPPFICDDSRPPLPPDLAARIAASVAKGDRSSAVGRAAAEVGRIQEATCRTQGGDERILAAPVYHLRAREGREQRGLGRPSDVHRSRGIERDRRSASLT